MTKQRKNNKGYGFLAIPKEGVNGREVFFYTPYRGRWNKRRAKKEALFWLNNYREVLTDIPVKELFNVSVKKIMRW